MSSSQPFAWVAGVALLLVAAWVIVFNNTVFVMGLLRKERIPSWAPLLGGCAGMLGLLVLPVPGLRHWWWVPLVIDWGCLPGLAHTAFWYLARPHKEEPTQKEENGRAGSE